ncbi:uncharacterized protein LOC100905546 [Galendromus occidentalis]|uniref:Uncharacterized protein LOC100905546 n=1 Tax=Galendromus occidentalis TaxID=34638 RepID=A0AAJ6QWJ6_9ACAR|nr:uncharacterized protein LOC100905546 [Galendromus occidentalis]
MAMQVPISFTVMEIVPTAENNSFRRKPLRAVPGEKISHLRAMSAESFNKQSSDIQLVLFGKILEDAWTFEAAGIREGSTVLVYPKVSSPRRAPQNKYEIQKKIYKGITKLYKMKYLNILARSEFLEKIYFEMPEVDTSTIALLQTSQLFVKWLRPKYCKELDVLAEKHPLLGDVLMKAIDWAPDLLKVIPPESPNVFSMEAPSDESDDESLDGASRAPGDRHPHGADLTQSTETATDSVSNVSNSRSNLQPGPSVESQPGPSRVRRERGVTGPMLQAALQAAYSSQTEVASQTFAWQLIAMREMGFSDEKACIGALVKSGGDLDMAVSLLFQD